MADVCYDEFWLPSDLENMGYIFEYCDYFCKKLFDTNIDKIKFLTDFMKSKCRHEMEIGHPQLLSQAAEDTVEDYVKVDLNTVNLKKYASNKNYDDYAENQFYWVGMMYAYIHYMTKKPSKWIVEKMPIESMLEEYYTGHQMSEDAYFNKIKDYISKL